MFEARLQGALRHWRANMVAMVIYCSLMGAINLFVEHRFAQYTLLQIILIHGVYNLVKHPNAWAERWMDKRLREWFLRGLQPGVWYYVVRGAADTIALALFQISLYLFFAVLIGVLFLGMEWWQIGLALQYSIIEHLCGGWLHGILADKCERNNHRQEPVARELQAACD